MAESMKKTRQEKPRKCKFARVLGCTSMHPPSDVLGLKGQSYEERNTIIRDKNLRPFYLPQCW
jgi:hypothetical protein